MALDLRGILRHRASLERLQIFELATAENYIHIDQTRALKIHVGIGLWWDVGLFRVGARSVKRVKHVSQ
jgi:hypothetical protein